MQVRTSHLLLTDIDLWPSSTAYARALGAGPGLLLPAANGTAGPVALVLPAFEYVDEVRRRLVPRGKNSMAKVPSLAGQSSPSPPPHLAIFGFGLLCALWRSHSATQRALKS